jgi:FdhD protein
MDPTVSLDPFPPTSRHGVLRVGPEARVHAHDELAEEVPVALEYNGIAHAVMLATPCDLEAFALGFSLSEGILGTARDLHDIEVTHGKAGITVHMQVSNAAFMALKARRRNLTGRTGCGLCGTERLDQVLQPLPRSATPFRLSPTAIRRALASLAALQPLAQVTGAVHAAAWATPEGELMKTMEDVGRHNALDKLIGTLAKTETDMQHGFALISSRASVEMVQKAAMLRMPALVAISAPTALAVRVAQQCGLTLIAFARDERFVTYSNSDNLERD